MDRDGEHATVSAGDLRDPAAEGIHQQCPRGGEARLVADALKAAKAAGAGGPDEKGLIVLRADSAFYNHDVIAAARRVKVRFSVTAQMSSVLSTAISSISDDDWTPITYPNAVWDDDEQRLISDAQIAEIGYTAFTRRRKADHIGARLILRRVNASTPRPPRPRTRPKRRPRRRRALLSSGSCSRSTDTTPCSATVP